MKKSAFFHFLYLVVVRVYPLPVRASKQKDGVSAFFFVYPRLTGSPLRARRCRSHRPLDLALLHQLAREVIEGLFVQRGPRSLQHPDEAPYLSLPTTNRVDDIDKGGVGICCKKTTRQSSFNSVFKVFYCPRADGQKKISLSSPNFHSPTVSCVDLTQS